MERKTTYLSTFFISGIGIAALVVECIYFCITGNIVYTSIAREFLMVGDLLLFPMLFILFLILHSFWKERIRRDCNGKSESILDRLPDEMFLLAIIMEKIGKICIVTFGCLIFLEYEICHTNCVGKRLHLLKRYGILRIEKGKLKQSPLNVFY